MGGCLSSPWFSLVRCRPRAQVAESSDRNLAMRSIRGNQPSCSRSAGRWVRSPGCPSHSLKRFSTCSWHRRNIIEEKASISANPKSMTAAVSTAASWRMLRPRSCMAESGHSLGRVARSQPSRTVGGAPSAASWDQSAAGRGALGSSRKVAKFMFVPSCKPEVEIRFSKSAVVGYKPRYVRPLSDPASWGHPRARPGRLHCTTLGFPPWSYRTRTLKGLPTSPL